MKINQTPLQDVLLIEPRVFGDQRGFFFESWNRQSFAEVERIYSIRERVEPGDGRLDRAKLGLDGLSGNARERDQLATEQQRLATDHP